MSKIRKKRKNKAISLINMDTNGTKVFDVLCHEPSRKIKACVVYLFS